MSNAITLPEPDGSAEANQRPHPGGGYEYDEVPAWSEPLVHAHAAAVTAAKDAEIAGLREDLQFVERWANHHASKPHTTPQEALSVIQHYPPIKAITKGYADGKVPDTFDPLARIKVLEDALRKAVVQNEHDMLMTGEELRAARAALGDKT